MANKLITTGNIQPLLTDVAEKISDINEQLHEPQTVNIEYPNNTAQVGVDATGTKYNMIESPETTIELNGKTLVNLWGNKAEDFLFQGGDVVFANGWITLNGNGDYIKACPKKTHMFKPSTEYTFIINVKENTLNGKAAVLADASGVETTVFSNTIWIDTSFVGTAIYKVTSNDEIGDAKLVTRTQITSASTEGSITLQMIILEGDYTDVPVKYFEGLKSAGETNENTIEVSSVGKNLLDCSIDKIKYREYRPKVAVTELANNRLLATSTTINNMFGWIVRVKPNTTYVVNDFHNLVVDDVITWTVRAYGFSYEPSFIHSDNEPRINTPYSRYDNCIKFTTTSDTKYMAIGYHTGSYEDKLTAEIPKPSLTEGNVPQEYEPYKESIQTIELSEPLRSLPNGVCDEAFIHDDKLVVTRNVGQITLNGNESGWWRNTVTDSREGMFVASISLGYALPNIPTSGIPNPLVGGAVCDKLVVRADTYLPSIYTVGNSLVVAIPNTHTPNSTIEEFKTWLSNNHVTIAYQLATPTYEWYELPSPHLYKEGTLFIETGDIPLTSNTHEIDVSVRSVIDTNVEEIMEIKEELNNLDLELMTVEESNGIWQGLLKGVNE